MSEIKPAADSTLPRPLAEKYRDRRRDALLPLLLEAQEPYGWLTEDIQAAVAEILRVPLADVHGVIEFYSMLYNKPTSRHLVRVCQDSICDLAGAEQLADMISKRVEQAQGVDGEKSVLLERVSCLGLCEHAPAALVGEKPASGQSLDPVDPLMDESPAALPEKIYGDRFLILDRVANGDPANLRSYETSGGYRVLRKAIESQPSEVIDLVTETGILGRGGAMFPVGRKWRFTKDAGGSSSQKTIVVNGDESEPGAFKDRVIMEGDPFAVIEAATLGAYAIGANTGWIFVRGEYALCFHILTEAVRQARDAGYLGRDIFGREGFDFDIEIRRGAGAYICGEETALFEAIEGKRGFPRKKPPFPVTSGLFQMPTAVNNVETLSAILAAISMGTNTWRSLGTEQSPGTKLFCLSGHVSSPGVYEMPFGITVRELIEMAGGVSSGKSVKAVLVGGAAGVFIGPESLDMPLTYEHSREYGVPLGSGALMVFDESVDLRRVLFQIGRFFAHESCGKCFPCQLGTQRQMEILERGTLNQSLGEADLISLEDIGFAMTQTSLCGLGQTAATALLSAMEKWPELYR